MSYPRRVPLVPAPVFGRRTPFTVALPAPAPAISDIKLFATTFAAGLLFMSVYLA